MRESLSVTTTATATSSKVYEGAPERTPRVFDEAPSVVLLHGKNRLQALRNLQKVADVASVEAPLLVRCIRRHDSHRIPKTEALKLSSLVNMVTSTVRRNS